MIPLRAGRDIPVPETDRNCHSDLPLDLLATGRFSPHIPPSCYSSGTQPSRPITATLYYKYVRHKNCTCQVFCWRQRQILDKSLSEVFSDSNTKELLSEAEQESDNLQSQTTAAEGSEMAPEQVIKTGLAVLQDIGPSGRRLA